MRVYLPTRRPLGLLILACLLGLSCHAWAGSGHGNGAVLTTVAQIHGLTREEAAKGLPVMLDAVVTYYESDNFVFFAHDATGDIYLWTKSNWHLHPGDRVLIHGVTSPSYKTFVVTEDILKIGTSPLPQAAPATFSELLGGSFDCEYVKVRGTVLSATMQQETDESPFMLMEVAMDSGKIEVHILNAEGLDPLPLLDSEVELTGISGGAFDGKYQLVGAKIYLNSFKDLRQIRPSAQNPMMLPKKPISQVMTDYAIVDKSKRVRVQGRLTLYEPGDRAVLERDGTSILVHTHDNQPLRLGDVVDAIGFPDPNDYSISLRHSQFLHIEHAQPLQPVPVKWKDALAGIHAFDLVSMEGSIIAQLHEPRQDTLVIQTDGHVFSAVLRRSLWPGATTADPLPEYQVGSRVRVSGICIVTAGGPWNNAMWYELHLRSADDITVLAPASWWTVAHLLFSSAMLLVLMAAALIWGDLLRRKVNHQTKQMHLAIEQEAEGQRRSASLEKTRAQVLEAINSSQPLSDVLKMVVQFISAQLDGLPCLCKLVVGLTVSSDVIDTSPACSGKLRHDILSGNGDRLGSITVGSGSGCGEATDARRIEVLEIGCSLAALAVDNRRLYDTLRHQSEYDQLTNAGNRFLFQRRLDEMLSKALQSGSEFAMIYVDIDRFKQVNDMHGHRTGDIYLQQIASRMSHRLRETDTLARIGGDEFVALIPDLCSREEAEQIAQRLSQCFEAPFGIENVMLRGSASIGTAIFPEDGMSQEELKRVADARMYAHKRAELAS